LVTALEPIPSDMEAPISVPIEKLAGENDERKRPSRVVERRLAETRALTLIPPKTVEPLAAYGSGQSAYGSVRESPPAEKEAGRV